MICYENIIIEVIETKVANERLEVWFKLTVLYGLALMDHLLGGHHLSLHFFVLSELEVETFPDTAEFSDRPKNRTFDLIKVVIENVGKFYEAALLVFDCQLNFTKDIPVSDIKKDIISSLLKPVDDPHQRNVAFFDLALPQYFIIHPYDLFLSRNAVAAEEIHNLERNERKIHLIC